MSVSPEDVFASFVIVDQIDSVEALTKSIQAKAKEISESAPKSFPQHALHYATDCMHEFVELNWSASAEHSEQEISQSFGIDGCNLPPFAKSPQLLLISRAIFSFFEPVVNENPEFIVARIRTTGLYQWLLDEPSKTFRTELEAMVSNAISNENMKSFLKLRHFEVTFLLECFHFLRLCNSRSMASDCLKKASDLVNIKVSFASALGKRTHFQTESLSQLFVKVEAVKAEDEEGINGNYPAFDTVDPVILPSNISLDDDTYLNEIKFENTDEQFVGTLSPTSQAFVLAKCINYAESLPKSDNFLREEVAAFIVLVLKNPADWAVQYHALYLRSVWEQMGSSSRKLDRALRQLDHLVSPDAYRFFAKVKEDMKTTHDDISEKLEHKFRVFSAFFAALPPAPWTVERALGDLLSRLGSTASALEIFERLHSWTDVIAGYTRLGRREKAEKLIQQQLALKRTPDMLVYLGDCTGEPVHYEEAWKLSNERCSKAQRNLGFYLSQKKDFAAAAACFEKCLAINPLQNAVWFAYGCVGFALKNYEMAASGFYKCSQLDPDNGEAWSNLATAYIKLNQKSRAVVILQEAIRCQYDNWRLWENYLLVTIDCGVFDEAIRAIHRLIDLRNKFLDADVLEILSEAVCKNIDNALGQPSRSHRSALLKLLGRILATSSPGARISRCHADVAMASDKLTTEDAHRAISSLQRAVRMNLQVPSSSWHDNDFGTVKGVLGDCLALHQTFLKYSSMPNASEADSLKTSLKYVFPQVLARAQTVLQDIIPNEENTDLLESLSKKKEEVENALKYYS